ncbi:MAG: EamA family transporter [Desulfobacteraceae bacterium]|nr:EamA family transporter [Desulfobacteraceae bacterium]
MVSHSNSRSIILGIIAVLLWCWSGLCFRKGSEIMGSSMVYLTFMTGCGSFTAVVLQYFRGQPLSDMVRLPFRVIIAGFFGVALYTVMLAKAFGIAAEADIGQINLLNYLWPVWMVVLGILLLGYRPNAPLAISGILMGLFGVAISRGFNLFTHLPTNLIPHALAVSGGFLWALYVVLLRKWNIPEEKGGTAFHFAICAIMAGLFAGFSHEWHNIPPWSGAMVFWIVVGGVGPVGIAYSLYEISVKNGPIILIASFAYFIPIGSSLVIGLFFKETMNNGLILGAVFITIGAWMIRRACNDA